MNSSGNGTSRRTTRTLNKDRIVDAEPFSRKRLGVFFGGSNARRLAVAFALSIALHEIAAGLVPSNPGQRRPQDEVVTHARIIVIARRPSPPPTPQVLIRQRHVPALTRIRARTAEGQAGARTPMRVANSVAPKTNRASSSKPLWDVTNVQASPGASLAGDGIAATGAGSGSGDQGNETGAASGDQPCGFVTFSDPHGSQFDTRTRGFWVDIRMSVHFSGGTSQSMILDYPWYYPTEAANPWSDQNLRDPNFPTRFQSPPAEKIAGEPPLVKYVMERSTPDGMTLLHDCPTPAPSGSGKSNKARGS